MFDLVFYDYEDIDVIKDKSYSQENILENNLFELIY